MAGPVPRTPCATTLLLFMLLYLYVFHVVVIFFVLLGILNVIVLIVVLVGIGIGINFNIGTPRSVSGFGSRSHGRRGGWCDHRSRIVVGCCSERGAG